MPCVRWALSTRLTLRSREVNHLGEALVLGLNDANKVAIAAGVRSCSRVKR